MFSGFDLPPHPGIVLSDLRAQLQATLGDAYRLERELGGGGMSRVFVAEERATRARGRGQGALAGPRAGHQREPIRARNPDRRRATAGEHRSGAHGRRHGRPSRSIRCRSSRASRCAHTSPNGPLAVTEVVGVDEGRRRRRSATRISAASSIATSSRITCCSRAARQSLPTSESRRPSAPREQRRAPRRSRRSGRRSAHLRTWRPSRPPATRTSIIAPTSMRSAR